jgi:hypothetical protein
MLITPLHYLIKRIGWTYLVILAEIKTIVDILKVLFKFNVDKYMQADIKYVMLAVGDLLELLDKVNGMMQREKKTQQPSQVMLSQYQDMKQDYVNQLAELLKDFDVNVQLPDKAA